MILCSGGKIVRSESISMTIELEFPSVYIFVIALATFRQSPLSIKSLSVETNSGDIKDEGNEVECEFDPGYAAALGDLG